MINRQEDEGEKEKSLPSPSSSTEKMGRRDTVQQKLLPLLVERGCCGFEGDTGGGEGRLTFLTADNGLLSVVKSVRLNL